MGIFSVLPRPVSSLVNPPPGVSPQPHRQPTERPERRRGIPTRPQQKNAVQRPTERRTAYTKPQHQQHPKPNHSTEPGRLFKITFYSNPDEVAAHRVAPRHSPGNAPQTSGTSPGCNGVAPQTEAAHSGAQAAQRAKENAPSRSPERCSLFIHFQQVGENHQRKNQNAK